MNNRRNFLKIAGVGLTGSLINPVNSSAAKISYENKSVKIGVLLPRSKQHPIYAASFLNGLRLALNTGKQSEDYKTEVITEQVNYGTPIIVKSKMQQLITENNVNLVVGLLNSEVSFDIEDTAKNAQIPTIIVNAGETVLRKKVKENPWLFFNTLNLLENSFQAGKYAVDKFGKNISVVLDFTIAVTMP